MKNNRDGKGVIFDLDGVLVDSGAWHKQAWHDLAAREGWHITDEQFTTTFGMQNYQIIPILAASELPGEKVEQMSRWKEQRYRDLVAGKIRPLPGARELLEDLRRHDFLRAIGTSGPQLNTDFVLNELKLTTAFNAFVGSSDVRSGKPAPDTFLKAAERLGLPPQRCVVVEDAVQGVDAGHAAGMAVVAVTNTRSRAALAHADRVVDSLAELTTSDFLQLLSARKAILS